MACLDVLRGSLALPVCAFLDMPDLCSVELAGFNRSASALCWKWLVEAQKGWSKRGHRLAPEDLGTASDKVKMLAMSALHAAFIQLSPHLANHVSPAKPLHLDVQPTYESHLHGGSLHPDVGASLPRFSRAWLSCQTLLGRDLAVGVEFQRTQEAAGQAVYLGVHFARARSDNLVIDAGVTVLFAPFSGQCQMLFEDENEVLQATALPRVSPCAQRVEAWLSISQSGALGFFRRQQGSNVIESSGSLVREAIVPRVWSRCLCQPCLCFSLSKLTADVGASVQWASDRLPVDVQPAQEEFDAVWCEEEV